MSEDSVLHGLNLDEKAIQDEFRNSSSAASVSRDLELAMWTNLHFPEEPIFSPERDQASKSRHKLIDSPVNMGMSNGGSGTVAGPSATDPVASGFNFFGSVGASLLPEPHARGKASGSNSHHAATAAALGVNPPPTLHDLFSWGMFDPSSASSAMFPNNRTDVHVDPYLAGNASGSNSNASPDGLSPYVMGGLPPLTIKGPVNVKGKQSAMMAQNPQAIDPANTTLAPPPAKRARLPAPPSSAGNTYHSQPAQPRHIHNTSLSSEIGDDDMEMSPIHPDDAAGGGGGPFSAAEDKRRRNTLASARFRAKKKEREALMETKARVLDEKVAELERECEVLRKENHWLKGLVVGASTNGTNGLSEETPSNSVTATPNNGAIAANEAATAPSALAAKGSVIDIDELLRVLRASGAVLTGGAANNGAGTATPVDGSSQKAAQGSTSGTGKRKRAINN